MQVKVAELIGESNESWTDAVQSAVAEASKKLGNITGVEVVNFTADVKDGKVIDYKANMKIAYVE
ncbi:dodecin family protein [Desulforudis sp. 1088]|uniref:dodecin family protein n=1 Tax=unclassified Candidatus Desulforudis TaxID=2635950 RepID=UPI003496C767